MLSDKALPLVDPISICDALENKIIVPVRSVVS